MVPAATEGPRPFRVPLRPGDLPERQAVQGSLYDSRFEHDACGVGFVADLRARGGHGVVASALRVLCNLEHRGAAGADPDTGDGAGILTQLPDAFFRAVTGFQLTEAGSYAAGLAFLSLDGVSAETLPIWHPAHEDRCHLDDGPAISPAALAQERVQPGTPPAHARRQPATSGQRPCRRSPHRTSLLSQIRRHSRQPPS